MKNVISLLFAFLPLLVVAQNQEGLIEYDEITKIQVELPEEMKQYEDLIPKERSTKMNLYFDEHTSFYTKSTVAVEAEENPFGGGLQTQVMTIGGGESSQIYVDQKEQQMIRSENVMGQQFLVNAPLEKLEWKILNEQKTILDYTCIKAELKVDSTSTLIAWFSPKLSVSIGPARHYGLPGAILEVSRESENASRTIIATNITFSEVSDKMIRPKKGKKVSQAEYDQLVKARMDEMRQGSTGGNGNIIIRTRRN